MPWRTILRVFFKPQSAHSRLKRAQSRTERGPSKVRCVKMTSFHFWEGAHSARGPSRGQFHPRHQRSGCATNPSQMGVQNYAPGKGEAESASLPSTQLL